MGRVRGSLHAAPLMTSLLIGRNQEFNFAACSCSPRRPFYFLRLTMTFHAAVFILLAILLVNDAGAFFNTLSRIQSSRLNRSGLLFLAKSAPPSDITLRRTTLKTRRPWTYTPLNPTRRSKVVSLVHELEENTNLKDAGATLDILSQWSRLGEGERAESLCNTFFLEQSPDAETANQALRRVLFAWCNELNRKVQKDPSRRQVKDDEYKKLARQAEQVLQKMDPVESGDYQAVIQAHAISFNVASALFLLKKCPSAAAYASVIRCILSPNCPVNLYERKNQRLAPVEMAHELLQECVSKTNNTLSPLVYNRVLNAWSYTLPHFSKKKAYRASDYDDVMEKVEWIWENIPKRDARTFCLAMYCYCKSGRAKRAYDVWEQLLEYLLASDSNEKERVDARSFKMLVNSLSTQNDADASEKIDSVITGMWKLHEAGYYDTAPNVFLVTTAMNSWAKHGNVDRVKRLLHDLETRYQTLKWKSLKADVAVYNALIHAIRNQEDIANAADEAGSVVKLMERNGIMPDTITCNTLMDVCLASNTKKGRERAEQTLMRMVEGFKRGNARVKPSLKSFSSLIHAWSDADSPVRAEFLLDVMEERYRPPASLFETIIMSWCRQAQVSNTVAAKRAMNLLLRMEELFEATKNEALRPRISLYNQVIQVLNDVGSGEDAFTIFEHRDRVYPPVDSTLEPRQLTSSGEVFGLLQYIEDAPTLSPRTPATVQNFNFVISQLGKSGKVWAGQRAEDVLNFMLESKKKFPPSTLTFNLVMSAYAKSSLRDAGEKAAAVLERMNLLSEAGILKDVKADRVSYNTLMNAYAKSSDIMPGSLAEAVFDELEVLYDVTQDETLKPDIVSYSTLLKALARGGDPYSANRAEEILLQMLKDYKEDRNNVKPNTVCFNEVIYAWARSPDPDAPKRAEGLLRIMQDMYHSDGNQDIKPDTRTYNVVLYALANSNDDDAPMRVALLLDEMKGENDSIKPDSVSYSTAISAFAKHSGSGAVNSTLLLLEELYESDIEVDSSFFSNLIYCLTRTSPEEAPIAAELILMDLTKRIEAGLVNVTVNTEIYNALINCWGKSGNRGSAARAEEILQEMQDEYDAGNTHVRPDVQTYTAVIDACAKSREADESKRAESVLNRLEEDGLVRPNAHTYTAVIHAYARSDSPSKAKHAQTILRRMIHDYENGNEEAQPSVVTYNAILNACEYSVGDATEVEDAFRVACDTLDEIRSCEYLSPDDITYGTFLGVIAKLMPKSETTNDLIELVFKRCCADGQLGPLALKKLGDAASVSRYRRLLGGVSADNVPAEWTCNVVTNSR